MNDIRNILVPMLCASSTGAGIYAWHLDVVNVFCCLLVAVASAWAIIVDSELRQAHGK